MMSTQFVKIPMDLIHVAAKQDTLEVDSSVQVKTA